MPEDRVFTLDDFYFSLPDELIAQYPAANRSDSRLFVLNRNESEYQHKLFYEIENYLRRGDILVVNNAKVVPARMYFKRKSGGAVEIVLTQRLSSHLWLAISNRTGRLKTGDILYSLKNPSIQIIIKSRENDYLHIETNLELTDTLLTEIGEIPLPPYIKRNTSLVDEERYQTVYAKSGFAAAAPTAGLHFSDALLNRLKEKGVSFAEVTLDVSWGTFQPVRSNDISLHKMHSEKFILPEKSAEEINEARKEERRIIAVGTTSLRVLESTFKEKVNTPGSGMTNIFIYPPYKIKSIDALITNFHTPHSTLLMLVSAFAGYDRIMEAYRVAIEKKYRFFSYGDAMLIL